MSIFRSGDKIHDFQHGEGKIDDLLGGYVYVNFRGNKVTFEYSDAKLRLSFTPYTLEHGGFSQERPKPEIEKGTPIWVRNGQRGLWHYGRFYSFKHEGVEVESECGSQHHFIEYSIDNPLKESI